MHGKQLLSAKYALHPLFYFVVLPSIFFFAFAVWSPPLFYSTLPEWFGSWQKALFSQVCHQLPARSLNINRVPLAVCSRCTGIYTGLFAAIVILPFIFTFVIKAKLYIMRVFALASLAIVLDGAANLFHLWYSTDQFRLITGTLWGMATGALLIYSLIVSQKHKPGDNPYGTRSK